LRTVLDEQNWSQERGANVLDMLLETASRQHLDFDTARQWGWTVKTLLDNQEANSPSSNADIMQAWNELAELLVLDQPRSTNPQETSRLFRVSATYDAEQARVSFKKILDSKKP